MKTRRFQLGYMDDLGSALVFLIFCGVLFGLFMGWLFPKVWAWIKPIIHSLTA